MVIIVGGTMNSTIKNWMNRLGIFEFNHVSVNLKGIGQDDMHEAAMSLAYSLPFNATVISIGPLADKLLTSTLIDHAPLPSTAIKDKNKINEALTQCKKYLLRRRFYVTSGPRIS